MNFVPVLDDIPENINGDQVDRLFEQVLVDHPEIFWFRGNYSFYAEKSTGIVRKIDLTYRYTQEEVQAAREKIAVAVEPFVESINDQMSDFEVVLRAYETLVNFVDYDTITLERQQKLTYEQRIDKPDPIRTIYGVFVDRKAVCAGYARAMQFLLKIMGIESAYVSSGGHAWNLVKLEGDYYHLDVTWADGSNTSPEKNAGDMIDYSFFCVTTEEILGLDAHQPTDTIQLPLCTATKCNYHHRFGLYFECYDEEKIRRAVCDGLRIRQPNLSFKFLSLALRDQAAEKLIQERKLDEMLAYAQEQAGIGASLSYTYSKSQYGPILNIFVKYN